MQTLGGLAKPECMHLPGLKGEDLRLGAWKNPTDPGWIMEHRDFLELWLLQITFVA